MTRLTRVYHSDLAIPEGIERPDSGVLLTYTRHAIVAASADRVDKRLPIHLPPYRLIEVETFGGMAVKWVVRFALDSHTNLCMALAAGNIVKTVWVKDAKDRHATLDITKYDIPEDVREKAYA